MRFRLVASLILAVIACAACYRWTPISGNAPTAQMFGSGADTVRIIPREGHPVRLRAAALQGDSLVGIDVWLNQRYAIAASQIRTVEVRQLGKGQTLAATLGGIVVIGGLVIGLALGALSSAPL